MFDEPANLSQIDSCTDGTDTSGLFSQLERIARRPLSSSFISAVLTLKSEYSFDDEKILSLIENCAANSNLSTGYILKVAGIWKKKSSSTPDSPDSTDCTVLSDPDSSLLERICDILHLDEKLTSTSNRILIKKWTSQWDMQKSLIEAACQKTTELAQFPSFSYLDKVLTTWHELGFTKAEDLQHVEAVKNEPPASKKKKDSFHNFTERKYDFAALEKEVFNNP